MEFSQPIIEDDNSDFQQIIDLKPNDHFVNIIVRLHSIKALVSETNSPLSFAILHVYDKTGSIELKLPLVKGITEVGQLVPGRTVISMENAYTYLEVKSGCMRLEVPQKMKYSKVYLYNHSEGTDEDAYLTNYCQDMSDQQVKEALSIRNLSKYPLSLKLY